MLPDYSSTRKKQYAFSVLIWCYLTSFIVFTESNGLFNLIRVVIVITLGTQCIQKRFRKGHYAFLVWTVGFLALCAMSVIWSVNRQFAREGTMSLTWNVITTAVIYLYCYQRKECVKVILTSFKYIPVLWVLATIYRFGFHGLFSVREYMFGAAYNRAGMLAAWAVIVSYFELRSLENKGAGNREIFFLLLNTVVCVLTTSRKSLIIIVIGCLLRELLFSNNPLKIIRNIIIGCILVLAIWFAVTKIEYLYEKIGRSIESMIRGMFMDQSYADASTYGRMNRITRGLTWFKDKIWIGHGLENYKHLSGTFRQNFNGIADNNYIELLVDLGLLGFIFYYGYILKQIRVSYKLLKESKQMKLFFIFLICLLVSDFGSCNYKSSLALLIIAICSVEIAASRKLAKRIGGIL